MRVGFVNDDVMHRAMLERTLAGVERGPDEAYCFEGGPNRHPGASWAPWWSVPDVSVCFFRPLSSLSLLLDARLFGADPLGPHLHVLAWFLGACGAVYALARRLFGARVALLATTIYGIANFTGSTVAWLAARHAAVTAALAATGIALYVAGREDGRPRRVALGVGLVTASLFAGEGGLGAFGFLAAYELVAATDGRPARAIHLAVTSAIASIFVVAYASAGFGTRNAGGYLDPIHHPAEFVVGAPGRFLALAADAIFGVPSEAYLVPAARPVLAVLGVLGLVVVASTARLCAVSQDPELVRKLRFLGIASLLAALPSVAAVVGGRVLMLPGVGVVILEAVLLERLFARRTAFRGPRRVAALVLLGTFGLGAFVLNPLMRVAQASRLRETGATEAVLARSDLAPCEGADAIYVLGTNELTVVLYAPYLLAPGIRGRPFHQVTLSGTELALRRPDARTLAIDGAGGDVATGMLFELLRPARSPFTRGDTVDVGPAAIRVGEVHATGIRSMELVLPDDGAAERACFLRYDGAHLVRTAIPAIGGTARIPYVAGPMSF